MMSTLTQTGLVHDFTSSIDTGWYRVTFPTPFVLGSTPVVMSQIQTRAGHDTPGLRMRRVDSTGFDVRMDEVILTEADSTILGDLGRVEGNGLHGRPEILGWIAVGEG